MELLASESVSIIETLIEEANKGEIDLEGLDTFWNYKTKVVIEYETLKTRMLQSESWTPKIRKRLNAGLFCSHLITGHFNTELV